MQEKSIDLKTPVRYFKGVGPKKSEELARIGITSVEDALYYLPKRYEDRSNFTPIKDLKIGENQTVSGEVATITSRRAKTGTRLFQIAITDRTGFVHAVWFNQPYLADYFKRGQRIVLYGKVELYDKLQIVQPEYEILEGNESLSIHIGRIVPVYSSAANLSQRYLRTLLYTVISESGRVMVETLPTYLRARHRLVDLKFALTNIHFPASFDNLDKAYRRIVFEEFLLLQLALATRKREAKLMPASTRLKPSRDLAKSLERAFAFEFTEGQKNAIAQIERDMAETRPMNRLLEGDVGSGKTAVAAYALALAAENASQAVLMAPTEVLARQHFVNLSELLMPLGINVALLIQGLKAAEKEKIYSDIKAGVCDVVVGTHAIIQESVEFKKLGLVVIDEQHKFGVTQRSILRKKGYNPHVLVMTATPIPRTLALTVFGDLDISIIRELPKGRKPITTYWVENEKRGEVYKFIREELDKGRQAYVVCPRIERVNSEQFTVNSVKEIYQKLKDDIFSNHTVGLLHGKMSSKEKDDMMSRFKKGKIDVLVSTVVIEVGIDVPNATVMLVENAERFGLAQLHQLRGRIGRGEHESYCVLLADPKTDEAVKRLVAIEGTLDGFQIAEADLDIRGPGEFFGTRQHGLPEIKFGDILKDFDIMELARKTAFELVSRDPSLSEEHHGGLRQSLVRKFCGKFDLVKVG